MSTTIAPPVVEAPAFDAKAHIEARMNGKPAPQQQKPAEEPKPEAEAAPVEHAAPKGDSSRSQRRALRAAEKRTAELVLEVLQKSGVVPSKKQEEAAETAAEPKRADFPAGDEGTAQFLRATTKFDKAQEMKQVETSQVEQESLREHYAELDAKAAKDIEDHFPDWDKLSKEWAANEDIKAVKYDDVPVVMGLLANSDLRSAVSYHWMQNPEAFLELCEMPGNKQIAAFHRLEGRLEKEYSTKKAAPASEPEKAEKDRKHLAEEKPAKATPGEPAAGGQPAKPKPSSEVVARGGSPPLDTPPIGSAAWMAMRNQKVYGR